MAGLSNVEIYINSNKNVSSTTATIYYYCDGTLPETDENIAGTRQYRYNTPSYSWTIKGISTSRKSGSVSVSGLTQGAANTIRATVTLTCDRDKYVWDDEKGWWIYDSTSIYTVDTETTTLTVYTRPGTFTKFSNITAGTTYISDILTTENVTAWCNHCNKYLSWKNQTTSTAANSCKVNKNDFITAAWYNKCAETCGISTRVSNDPTKSNSLITAECIKALGTAISSYS